MREKISAEKIRSEFVKQLEEISGQNLLSCYQCGKCSAGCPIAMAMDFLPNQIIRMAQLGLEEELLSSKAPWLCASCLTCTSRCPKGVDIARIMGAIRSIILRTGVNYIEPAELGEDLLAEAPQQAIISSYRKYTC